MASARALTDHDEIRSWAEQRKAKPACVKGTGEEGDPGMIRLDFPGFSGRESLQPISWKEWFRQFDSNDLALMVQDTTARGQTSNFNKLVSRGSVRAAAKKTGRTSRASGVRGAGSGAAKRSTSSRRGTAKTAAKKSDASRAGAKRSSTKTASRKGSSSRSTGAGGARAGRGSSGRSR